MKLNNISWSLGMIFTLASCSGFLDVKPDIKLIVPQTIKDAELLLHDYTTLNTGYPNYGELGTDDYYLTDDSWKAVSNLVQRNAYNWIDESYVDPVQWQRPYKAVFVANQALDVLAGLDASGQNGALQDRLTGTALFFRAFAFHQLVEVFCPGYSSVTASAELGIPLRLKPDLDENSVRASLKDSYDQIITDYRASIIKLPNQQNIIGQPDKAAAFAGLARVYLAMGGYEDAFVMADSCLTIKSDLLNFNLLRAADDLPIQQFNEEVLFPAMSAGAGPMGYYTALVDMELYNSYDKLDLRKKIFFQLSDNIDGAYNFKGNYGGSYSQLFVGLTTSEVYLIKAEAAVRTGKIESALESLNKLRYSRWKTEQYTAITESDPELLLKIILEERRKELLFRGRRWSDLKRLNLDDRFQKTLTRIVNGKEFTLVPNSPKYAFRLPETVINNGKISQNKR